MSDALPTTDSREDVFGRFFEDLETTPDKEAVVRQPKDEFSIAVS